MTAKGSRIIEECLTSEVGVATFWVHNNMVYTFLPIKTGYVAHPLDVIFTKEN